VIAVPDLLNQPPKRLIGLQKVALKAVENRTVTMTIGPPAPSHPLSTWNIPTQQWVTSPVQYPLQVGNSSDALSLQRSITISR
jgi:beta-glucosidase